MDEDSFSFTVESPPKLIASISIPNVYDQYTL